MRKILILIFGAIMFSTISFNSCNFLDVDTYFEATFKEDSIFHTKKNAEGYLWNTPTRFPDPGSIWGNSWYPGESASDEITLKYRTNEFWGLKYTVGTINSRNLPNRSLWYDMYVVIKRCNRMLENVNNVIDMTELDKNRYVAYVHFIRGYAYYHLLMNWGPLLIVGDEVLSTSEPAEYYNKERSTFDESIDYIVNEFELSLKGLYSASEQSINYFRRPTKGAALALIARLRLYQASPAFNGEDIAKKCFANWTRKSDGASYVNTDNPDPKRWAIAAAAAKQVIDMNYYSLHVVEADKDFKYPIADNVPTEKFPNGAGGIDPYKSYADMFNGEGIMQVNKEFIWATPSGSVESYTRHSFPVKFGGWGAMSIPQRVIDCYLMADGRTIDNASEEYPYSADLTQTLGKPKQLGSYILKGNVPMMYANRSARFYASIGFPGRFWPMNSASSDRGYVNKQFWYSNEDNDSGKSGTGQNINDYTVSGYVPVKYIHPDDSFANGKGNVKGAFITSPKPFAIIRYAEVLLEYCEALNNVEEPTEVEVCDETGEKITVNISRDENEIQKYFNMIRYRVGLPGIDNDVTSDKATLEKVIRNERQVELFNEGYRYFDTRRWGTFIDDANSTNWRGLDVNKDRNNDNGNEGFWNLVTIDTQNIRDRISDPKLIFLPLDHSELIKVPNASQNPGWDR